MGSIGIMEAVVHLLGELRRSYYGSSSYKIVLESVIDIRRSCLGSSGLSSSAPADRLADRPGCPVGLVSFR